MTERSIESLIADLQELAQVLHLIIADRDKYDRSDLQTVKRAAERIASLEAVIRGGIAMLSEVTKARIRMHLGIPTAGIPQTGSMLGTLEYRFINAKVREWTNDITLSPHENDCRDEVAAIIAEAEQPAANGEKP